MISNRDGFAAGMTSTRFQLRPDMRGVPNPLWEHTVQDSNQEEPEACSAQPVLASTNLRHLLPRHAPTVTTKQCHALGQSISSLQGLYTARALTLLRSAAKHV
jgi:hypothetical protein